MEYKKPVLNFLKNIINTQNYDIFSIINIDNIEISVAVDIVDSIKSFYDCENTRSDLHKIKMFYQNIFYNNLDNKLYKLQYIIVLYIGNKNYNKNIMYSHVYNYSQYLKSLNEDIINLEKRFINLKEEISRDLETFIFENKSEESSEESSDDESNNFTPIKIKRKSITI